MKKLTSLFNPEAFRRAERDARAFKSRTGLTWITPRDFLKLTPVVEKPDIDYYVNLIRSGQPIENIPFLRTEQVGDMFKVVGHEGRHRCMAIVRLNIRGNIPVLITDRDTRWEEEHFNGKVIQVQAQAGTYKHELIVNP